MWLILVFSIVLVFVVFIITTAPLIVGFAMVIVLGLLLVFSKPLLRGARLWQEKRRIASQPNAHQRGYILQRLRQLPYNNDDSFSARDLGEDNTLTVRHYLDECSVTAFIIEFVKNEYVGPADIGNEYRRTKHRYYLSPKRSTIKYEESTGLRRSGSVDYHKYEARHSELDHLPDEVIEHIEYALLNWEPAPTS
ncbi:hypothetical protein D3C73_15510 [compost metagenome]